MAYNNKFQDLTGQRFNLLAVVEYLGMAENTRQGKYLCRCDCGTEVVKYRSALVRDEAKSCGCINLFKSICSRCKVQKTEKDFYKRKDKNSKCGYSSICKECRRNLQDEWREENPSYNTSYGKSNRTELSSKERRRYHSDLNFKLRTLLRSRIKDAVKWIYKAGSAVEDLGIDIPTFKLYIENQFYSHEDGTKMTWDNHGKWHLDHVQPLCTFDLTDRMQFLEACNWLNIQPLWAKDNQSRRRSLAVR